MKYWFAEGKVNSASIRGGAGGYLVIYGNIANYSDFGSTGHDELLEEIAVRNRYEKTEALSKGIRLFFAYVKDGIVISGVRKIDNDKILENPAGYAKIISRVLK